ncbi:cation:proton antiporter [Rhizocola hellebori]|uniref:Cation:proton antiporter n=1 Tax=Rhizocola hellebori TaxID=1392758 RepID=A0A8J3Q8A3_9ACTN|nr:cation:proton antiporter [Rhizocola hellebori]GIH05031.1 cation:proton antiporter [Rhizocola hellebori]
MTGDQILIGVGLTLVLAVGSQILASRLRIPALIVLLPAGFLAGALTDTIHPDLLLGAAFQPLVSLAVAVILYDAGLTLELRRLKGHLRHVVIRLIAYGIPITLVLAAAGAAVLLGMSKPAALMLGTILVVSGPTVVGPLLNFVRPAEHLQRILIWEGTLIDPVGVILGTVVLGGIVATHDGASFHGLGQFLLSLAVGVIGGAIGTVVLWFLLRKLELNEVLGTSAQLATVIGVAAACNVVRDDTGLTAAIVIGLAVANLPRFDIPARRPFLETTVQLILGVLFISISATITPESLRHLVLPTLGLVALLVLVARPLIAFLASIGTDLSRGERLFVGWMAPRGIVAAVTASTFSATLAAAGIGGAEKILPATFLVIVATVTIYGLTAAPMAKRLGVTRPARTRPLLIGGDPWVLDLGRLLQARGLEVLMWAGSDQQREQIEAAGLELAPGEVVAAATGEGVQIEGVTAVLLLTNEDDFNSLAAVMMHDGVDGPVYRLAPPHPRHGVVAPYLGGEILFGPELSGAAIAQRYSAGSRIFTRQASGPAPALVGHDVLFVIRADGQLIPVTRTAEPDARPGDDLILLGPAGA